MAKMNELHQAALEVAREQHAMWEKGAKAIPFGMEQLTPDQARTRWSRLTPEQRIAHIQQRGADSVLRFAKKGGA